MHEVGRIVPDATNGPQEGPEAGPEGDRTGSKAEGEPASAARWHTFATVVLTRVSSPPEDLHHAFNKNQIASKQWLLDRVHAVLGGRFGTVVVLGGWHGVLAAMLLADRRFSLGRVISVDLDPRCVPVAEQINCRALAERRFAALCADACALDYGALELRPAAASGPGAPPGLVINTSCEHMPESEAWYDRVPRGVFQVYQSNDYFDCPEHVNCVPDLEAFKKQIPMTRILYEGVLPRRRYRRFMLIGRK
ncbi:MAG: class I SAM-dependent methyltransferase [Alphaproteobacteria bacterium]|nr:MAG: class I SAM-dependent methyltransferase [Alphaproteobacteria bacterium]